MLLPYGDVERVIWEDKRWIEWQLHWSRAGVCLGLAGEEEGVRCLQWE